MTCPARAPTMNVTVAPPAQGEKRRSTWRDRISLRARKAAIARIAAKRSGAKTKGPMAIAFISAPCQRYRGTQRLDGDVADEPGAARLRRIPVEEDHGGRADDGEIAHQ